MINKKVIFGLFAIFVILTYVQSFAPVFAAETPPSNGSSSPSPDGNANQPVIEVYRVAVDVQGEGQVCWSGVVNGCTSGSMTLDDTALFVPIGSVLTFTATGGSPVWFVDGQFSQGPPTLTATGLDHTIIAQFTQNMS